MDRIHIRMRRIGFLLLFLSEQHNNCRVFVLASGTKIPVFGPDFVPSNLDNMNGLYPLSRTPGAMPNSESSSSSTLLPRNYKDYPGGAESFDVYSPPMSTLYSQVWWKPLEPVELPSDVVEKYAGKGMAILGWEIDQVLQTVDGEDDISVPISASYNHHYSAVMIGAEASFRKVEFDGPDDPLAKEFARQNIGGCGGGRPVPIDQPHFLVEGLEHSSELGLPTRQQFNSGNGGEYRKTFHGFSPSNVLVIDSPTSMQISPMQIDTWNRDQMNISGPLPPEFVPGPLPRASLSQHDSLHSGLLECPMTTRLTKVVDSASYVLIDRSEHQEPAVCEERIVTSYECYEAAGVLLGNVAAAVRNETGKDRNQPRGCSIITTDAETHNSNRNSHRVFFNEFPSSRVSCSVEARCVCTKDATPFGKAKGALLYHPTNQSEDMGRGKADYFNGDKCASWPRTSLLGQRNPTCDIRYYRGGQWACHHMWSLLDADQEIPWTDRPLVFRHKYRFWVQPHVESYHQSLTQGEAAGSALLIGSPWEYDIPKCSSDISGCELVDGIWVHTIQGSTMGRNTFVTLNNHCHAPACLSASVFACRKGTALAECNASTGRLICETRPVYGGTNHPDLVGTKFDEPGYIAIPDCLWGSEEYGLEAPLDLDGVPLHIVKKANATEAHYGEMSGGQPWVIIAATKESGATAGMA